MGQHEIVELTTNITNLRLTNTWQGTTKQFLTHFKEKLHLLDSLVEESDKIPKTTHIGFLQQAVKSIPDLHQFCVMDTVWHQETGSSGALSYQSYYDLLKSAAYHHDITVNSAVKSHRAYTFLTHEDDDFGMGSTNIELDHPEDDICTHEVYLTNLSSPMPSHTPKLFLPKSIWNELTNKVRKLIIAHNKNIGSSS